MTPSGCATWPEHAARHGLRYLADAEPGELRADRQPPGVDAQLDALAGGSRVVWEQYADLLAGRAFRQTLLCRAGAPLDDAIAPARMARLWFRATESAGGGGAEGEPGSGRGTIPPATARAARRRSRGSHSRARGRSPSTSCTRRSAGATPRRSPPSSGTRSVPARSSSTAPDRHVTAAGERPATSALARWQAARGPELTNLRHEPVRLNDPLGRMLIRLCDGRATGRRWSTPGRQRRRRAAAHGRGEPVTDGETVRGQIAGGLQDNLGILAGLAMLRA